MRSEKQILSTLLSVAKNNDIVRAVLLNGSRTNVNIQKDDFQDYDVIFLVEELSSFENDSNWIDVFGERIILQMPNSMEFEEADLQANKEEIVYLMLFKDFNRIDLRLVVVKNIEKCMDSLNSVLLDKDNLFESIEDPTDKDYLVRKPSQKQFDDCCNEFWWVSTYVVKGLARKEPTYSKDMLEVSVRRMFMKMLAWYAGSKTGFTINTGKSNRFLKNHVSEELWTSVLKTYPDAELRNIWASLLEMTRLFHELAQRLAKAIDLNYNTEEANNVQTYMKSMEKKIF